MRTSGKCLSTLLDQRWMGDSRVTPYMTIRHTWRETGAEMHPALVSGMVSRDSLVSYWPIFVVSSPVTDPEVFAKVNAAQFPSRFSMPYATCTSPIMHLICPQKIFHNQEPMGSWHNLCFSFPLGITAVPREIKNNAYAKFAGQIRRIMGYVQVPHHHIYS